MKGIEKLIGPSGLVGVAFLGVMAVQNGFCMDERYFRSLLSGELKKKEIEEKVLEYKWQVGSSLYRFDLDKDGYPEYFQISKRDGEDWLTMMDWKKKTQFEYKLDKLGDRSRIHKLTISRLEPTVDIIVVHFYEGMTRYPNFTGAGRLHFITVERENGENYYAYKGPSYWDERGQFKEHYHQRFYQLSMPDYDGDGRREVRVKFKDIDHIYKYLGNGRWKKL